MFLSYLSYLVCRGWNQEYYCLKVWKQKIKHEKQLRKVSMFAFYIVQAIMRGEAGWEKGVNMDQAVKLGLNIV